MKSICYLSDDYDKHKASIPVNAIICPEYLKNGQQIKEWVSKLNTRPGVFVTCSLYLIRELELQKIDVEWVNITDKGVVSSNSPDNIGNIEILDRELEQSDRYINHAMGS